MNPAVELIFLLMQQTMRVIQDIKDGKIDPETIDLDAARTNLINLPLLPEEPA